MILERERKGGGEKEGKNIDLFHVFMHSLVQSCMCPVCADIESATLVNWDDILKKLSYLARVS